VHTLQLFYWHYFRFDQIQDGGRAMRLELDLFRKWG